jgi:transposase
MSRRPASPIQLFLNEPLVGFLTAIRASAQVVWPTRRRNLIERRFWNLRQFRRIATRFEKLAQNLLASAALASTRPWLLAIEFTP